MDFLRWKRRIMVCLDKKSFMHSHSKHSIGKKHIENVLKSDECLNGEMRIRIGRRCVREKRIGAIKARYSSII